MTVRYANDRDDQGKLAKPKFITAENIEDARCSALSLLINDWADIAAKPSLGDTLARDCNLRLMHSRRPTLVPGATHEQQKRQHGEKHRAQDPEGVNEGQHRGLLLDHTK